MFLIVNLIFVIAAGLMVLVVAATASLQRPAVDRDPVARTLQRRGVAASE